MKHARPLTTGILAGAGMLALILDPVTAFSGASSGIDICIKTVIPSLFPFFVLSLLLTGALAGANTKFTAAVEKWCHLPPGAGSLVLVGLLSGYPAGAQCVSQAYSAGHLPRNTACRMLGFCNNSGPAFIFGVVGSLFPGRLAPLLLWMIHIFSALLVARIIPDDRASIRVQPSFTALGVGQALTRATRTMAAVCGWIIVFRMILTFAQRWFLWLIPQPLQVMVCGILELTNGCLELHKIPNEQLRFLLASIFISFGGLCVSMQTSTLAGYAGLDHKYCLPGKLLHTALAAIISLPVSAVLFPVTSIAPVFTAIFALLPGISGFLMLKKPKNNSSNPEPCVV